MKLLIIVGLIHCSLRKMTFSCSLFWSTYSNRCTVKFEILAVLDLVVPLTNQAG